MTIVMSGQLSKDKVAKLLERITVPDTKSGNREITPMESASTQLKTTGTQKAQSIEKCPKEKIVPVSHCNRSMEFKVPDIKCAFHISIGKDNKPWTSDDTVVVFWSEPIYMGIDFRFYLPMVDMKASTQSHGKVNWCTRTRKCESSRR